jgi:hypothetical protein
MNIAALLALKKQMVLKNASGELWKKHDWDTGRFQR